jgi:hypothetical protein
MILFSFFANKFLKTKVPELRTLSSKIYDQVDRGLRHLNNIKPDGYLAHFLSISRLYAYATHDGSWGEFEKEFATIVKRMVIAEKKLEMLGIKDD